MVPKSSSKLPQKHTVGQTFYWYSYSYKKQFSQIISLSSHLKLDVTVISWSVRELQRIHIEKLDVVLEFHLSTRWLQHGCLTFKWSDNGRSDAHSWPIGFKDLNMQGHSHINKASHSIPETITRINKLSPKQSMMRLFNHSTNPPWR